MMVKAWSYAHSAASVMLQPAQQTILPKLRRYKPKQGGVLRTRAALTADGKRAARLTLGYPSFHVLRHP